MNLNELPLWLEILLSALLLLGGLFVLIGAIGLVRLPDFFTRLHAPTKASTLGLGAILLGSMVLVSVSHDGVSLHELLITLFLFITAPVSAHMMCRAALHQRLKIAPGTRNGEYQGLTLAKQQEQGSSRQP
ncbi:Na+/H+ antiporter subunit G [Pokkaliibacter sp. MBI-7]|uniref:Na+/H+ antiporter subunit G n=1 Tax=Pokkaliibacter sp. MBI-7 TaxID=3040600 RepID=UPI00244A96EE|nr:Na+/H+ antiporter subunit G [Pokkaliibacter sp. MBI-7]MDH2433131.1 Na+/H+ antiporter subunit G [Pokkaliibacter sp. MBI-7]